MKCLEVILVLAIFGDAVNRGDTAEAKELGSIVCGAHEYQCENGACIPLAGRCNESKECADGSDESDCGKCGLPDHVGWYRLRLVMRLIEKNSPFSPVFVTLFHSLFLSLYLFIY